jgi:iron(III) transport system substrate-binding protein
MSQNAHVLCYILLKDFTISRWRQPKGEWSLKRLVLFPILMILLPLLLIGCTQPLTLYTDAGQDNVQKLVTPFTHKTGIQVNIVSFTDPRTLADAIAVDINGEYKVVPPTTLHTSVDVVFSNEMMVGEVLRARGVLQQYTPAAAGTIPSGAKLEGWWYGMGGHVWVIAWNTDLVTRDPPKSLLDLSGTRFPQRAISMVNPNYFLYYSSGASAILGKMKITDFLQQLIDKDTQWMAKPGDTAQSVADGTAFACVTTLEEAVQLQSSGAPIGWAVPDQGDGQMGAYLQFNVVGLSTTSTTPDNARKLVDYLLEPETEKLSVELGLSDSTTRPCGSGAPVVRPLDTDLAMAQKAMQNDLWSILTYFTVVNPKYKGK